METRAEQAQGQAVESPGAQATEELACPDAELYARFFRVLGDPTRIRILHLLLSAPPTGRTVSERVERLVQPQGRVWAAYAGAGWSRASGPANQCPIAWLIPASVTF